MRDLPPIHQCCAVYSHFNEEHDDSPVEHDGFFRKPKPWWWVKFKKSYHHQNEVDKCGKSDKSTVP